MKELNFTVGKELDGKTIKEYLKAVGLSSNLIKKVKFGGVFLRGENVHMRATVKERDDVRVLLPEGESEHVKPIELPLCVLYEDEALLAVDKPTGMPVHPARGNHLPTLAEAVAGYLFPEKTVFRAVNRLDRDTSGIVLIAKDAFAAQALGNAMKMQKFDKEYVAVVEGVPNPEEGEIDLPIERESEDSMKRTIREDGKPAKTRYRVLRKNTDGTTLVLLIPLTGRTHQLRVHMAAIGHPLVGDFLYGTRRDGETYSLRCFSLTFPHPLTGELLTVKTLDAENYSED